MSSQMKNVKLKTEQDPPVELSQLTEMYDNAVQQFRELLQRVDPANTVEQKNYSHHLKAKNHSADDKSDKEPNKKRSEVAQSEESLQGTINESDDERTSTEVLRVGEAPQETHRSPLLPVLVDLTFNTVLPSIVEAAGKSLLKSNQIVQQTTPQPNYNVVPALPPPSQPIMPAYSFGQGVQPGYPYNPYQQPSMQGAPSFGPQVYPRGPYPPQRPGSYPTGLYPAPTYASASWQPGSYPRVSNQPQLPNNQQFGPLQPIPQLPGQGIYPGYSQRPISTQPQSGPQQGTYQAQPAPVKLQQILPIQNQPGPVNPQGPQVMPTHQPVQRPSGPLPPQTTFILPPQQNVAQGQPPPGYSKPNPQQPAKLGQMTQVWHGNQTFPQGSLHNPQRYPQNDPLHKTLQGQPTAVSQNPPQQLGKPLQIPPGPPISQQGSPGKPQGITQTPSQIPGQGQTWTTPLQGPNQPQAIISTTANPPSTLKILPAPRESPQKAMVPGPTRSTPPGAHQMPGQLPEYVAPVSKNHQEGPFQPQGLPLWSQLQPPSGENCPYYQESPTVTMQVQTGNADNKIQTPRGRKARVNKPKSPRQKLEGEVLQSLMDLDDHINVILNKLES